MSLRVVSEKSEKQAGNTGVVVLEGESPEEVMNLQAKHMALEYASGTLGIYKPGLNIGSGSYPVGPDGEIEDAVAAANNPYRKYRFDYSIQGGL